AYCTAVNHYSRRTNYFLQGGQRSAFSCNSRINLPVEEGQQQSCRRYAAKLYRYKNRYLQVRGKQFLRNHYIQFNFCNTKFTSNSFHFSISLLRRRNLADVHIQSKYRCNVSMEERKYNIKRSYQPDIQCSAERHFQMHSDCFSNWLHQNVSRFSSYNHLQIG